MILRAKCFHMFLYFGIIVIIYHSAVSDIDKIWTKLVRKAVFGPQNDSEIENVSLLNMKTYNSKTNSNNITAVITNKTLLDRKELFKDFANKDRILRKYKVSTSMNASSIGSSHHKLILNYEGKNLFRFR